MKLSEYIKRMTKTLAEEGDMDCLYYKNAPWCSVCDADKVRHYKVEKGATGGGHITFARAAQMDSSDKQITVYDRVSEFENDPPGRCESWEEFLMDEEIYDENRSLDEQVKDYVGETVKVCVITNACGEAEDD